MHGLGAALVVVMAAEKSRTVFYVVGGITAAWAVVLTLALGLRRPSFPGSPAATRLVMAVSIALVIGTGATSILTESTPARHPVATTTGGR
jgi:hypothetical protein